MITLKEKKKVDNIIKYNPNAHKYFNEIKNGILFDYYDVCDNFYILLKYYLLTYYSLLASRISLQKNFEIYRARNIHVNPKSRKFNQENLDKLLIDCNGEYSGFYGYNCKESGAPSSRKCLIGGRCNHPFESVLYAAEHEQIAVAEIKNLSSKYFSVAKIVIKYPVLLANFSANTFRVSGKDDPKEKWFNDFAAEISDILNKSVDDDSCSHRREIYSITQYITDIIRKLKYDGIRFTSSKMQYVNAEYGHNIVLFKKKDYKVIASKIVKCE